MPRRILILTNRVPYPLHDGGALAMDAMIRGYKRKGWHVHVLAMNTSRHHVAQEVLAKLYSDLDSFQTVEVDNSVTHAGILKNFLFSRQPEHATRFQSPEFASRLATLLQNLNPDVVQLESPFLAGYIPLIRRLSKARIVYRAHNIEGQIWERLASESRGFKRSYLKSLSRRIRRYEGKLWAAVDLILPITDADAGLIRAAGIQTPLTIAPFGIRTPPQAYPLPAGPLKIYHLGAMDWIPNREAVAWFIKEVWPLARKASPTLSFHFAGRSMPPAMAENLPEGVSCADEVADAAAFIEDKQVLVVPLRSAGGIRIKTLEAIAAGKLVISTDIGMQGIDAVPDLHYLRANTATEFAQMIAWASQYPEKVAAVIHNARRLVSERYDADTIMSRVVTAINDIIKP